MQGIVGNWIKDLVEKSLKELKAVIGRQSQRPNPTFYLGWIEGLKSIVRMFNHLDQVGKTQGIEKRWEALDESEKWLLQVIEKQHGPKQSPCSQKTRSSIQPSLRFKIFRRDEYECAICGKGKDEAERLEVDHIEPVSEGGTEEPENLQTLCWECNAGKSDREM